MIPEAIDRTPRPAKAGIGDVNAIAAVGFDMLQALIDAVPARVVFIDNEHRYRYVNRLFLDFLGLPESEVLGRTPGEVLGEEISAGYHDLLPRIHAGETFRWTGWADYHRFGKRYVEETVLRYAPAGEVLGIISIGLDLTELRQREQELAASAKAQAESSRFHAAVVATAIDCIIVVDDKGDIIEFNPAAEQTFGFKRAEVLGLAVADVIIPPELRGQHVRGMADHALGGGGKLMGRRVEQVGLKADGTRFPVELALSEVNIDGRRLYTAHIRDLTAARQAQTEIERQRDTLYQKEKLAALGSMLSGVAHELNNPLSIVVGQSMMLREQLEAEAAPASSSLRERGMKISQAAERCSRIVKSFLAMARQRKAEPRAVTVETLVQDVLSLLAYGLRSSGIQVSTDIPADLPPIWVDGDQIHQILVNLVINAQQAMDMVPSSARRIFISACKTGANRMELSVQDGGPGVAADIRTRIFDPFFTTKPQEVGTGIGLAVSRGLAESNGGTLDLAEQEAGHGARFVLSLPTGEKIAAKKEFSAETEQASSRRRPLALVVEDESELAELLAELLSCLNVDAVTAEGGEQARTMVTQSVQPFDMVLCDMRMPGGDGPTFYAWLQKDYPHIAERVAFVTGDTLGPSAVHFLQNCGRPLLEKPFTLPDLQALVAQLLDMKSA
ncbi:hybrid sensor histidine kinase/response regulator [Oryzicola mucosus]|uniref:histidine kinase n=1 Tax=Oryzicola mucosus TaxID=2767425 RepID=A0A8J6PEQ1_9HYPH|nr:PAS domain S-box protein [Oryzicola mucosus]MBD0413584.1 PAS domain S-box protein [Oryzicola mucosus]